MARPCDGVAESAKKGMTQVNEFTTLGFCYPLNFEPCVQEELVLGKAVIVDILGQVE